MIHVRTVPLAIACAAARLATTAPDAAAQSSTVSYGITAAAFGWQNGLDEQALAAVVQLTPARWLTLGASPTLLRIATSDGTSHIGFTDLPIFAGATHTFAVPWRPTLGVAGVALLPTGDASQGLGRGESLVSAEGAFAISPLAKLAIRAGASRLVLAGDSTPHGIATTAIFGDAVLLASTRTNLSIGYAFELQGDASATYEPARMINATIVHTLVGSTALTLSAGHTLRGAGPGWSLAFSIGTAFAGLAPVGATSPAARSAGGITPPANGGLLPLGGASCRLITGC